MRVLLTLAALLPLAAVSAGAPPVATPPIDPGPLTIPRMLELAPLPRAEFIARWAAARDGEIGRLERAVASGGLSRDALTVATLRARFVHAQGRVMYPFFHWRETDAPRIEPDPELRALLAQLPPIDARLWELEEVRAFVDAQIHALARQRLETDPGLQRGDARWLRARLAVLDEVLKDPNLRAVKAADILAKHIDDDGAAGVDGPLNAWLGTRPKPADVERIRAAIAADRAHLEGVRVIPYREVGGVQLHLYLREPVKPRSRPRPAMLWLHGGSATEGTWWHSPVTAKALLEQGVVTIGVELTTGDRFDRDADQISDSSAAFEHVLAHAAELDLDPRRIGVAGFSSGASLALLLVTRGAAPTPAGSGLSPRFPRPAAAIVSGACADPLSKREDGYFRKTMGRYGDPAAFSPFAMLRMALPPVVAIHATADEFCSFADMEKFAQRSRELGNEVTLISVEGASHFFGFYHAEGQRLQREAIGEALVRWGW